MNSQNLFFSNFNFADRESHLKFKFKMLNSSMMVIVIMTFLIALLSHLGINDIGTPQMMVNYLHSLATLMLIFFLRFSKELFESIVVAFIATSFLNITSALIFVTHDEFRIVWFFIVIYVAYMLSGIQLGMLFTVASISVIIVANIIFELMLSSFAIYTSIYGIIVGSLLMRAHAKKIEEFENSILKQNEQLKKLSSVDQLTGIMNERVFYEVGLNFFENGKRHNSEIIVLTLDIDNLKNINSDYGHQVGDLLIIRFTEVVNTLLRKSDVFARIQDHKFVILIYKTDLDGAMQLAEKIRKKVKGIMLAHESDFIQITVSIGIAQVNYKDESIQSCITASNDALIQAKQEGKDRICVH